MSSGKRVLITGASRGIGLAFAKHYNALGWNVIATARTPSSSSELQQLRVEAVVPLDVACEESIKEAAKSIGTTTPIDLIINNAGIILPDTLRSASKANMIKQYEVNAIGPFLVSRAFVSNLELAAKAGASPAITAQISARIASLGCVGEPGSIPGLYGYKASKTALNSLTKALSVDLKPRGIASVLVHPGFVKTDMSGQKGKFTPDQSVEKIAAILAKTTIEDTGNFYHIDGTTTPW
ncbi:unnamed protein product [Aphanomyces euteiches]